MDKQRATDLLDLHLQGALSSNDWRDLREACEVQDQALIIALSEQIEKHAAHPVVLDALQEAELFKQIVAIDKPSSNPQVSRRAAKHRWLIIAAAASIISIAVGLSHFFPAASSQREQDVISELARAGIQPGGNKAWLTLSDGTILSLDSQRQGILNSQQGAQISVTQDGAIAYILKRNEPEKNVYNTLHTPKGGQYQVTLSDGTKVWLNAASSIRFPILFGRSDRRVTIEGEAYLEIQPDKLRPFIVAVGDKSTVQVLGTRFSVNSYQSDSVKKITLFDGSVQIVPSLIRPLVGRIVLKPGQAGEINQSGPNADVVRVKDNANLEQTIAWKNGRFDFDNLDLTEVMSQLARWYDVEVTYPQIMKKYVFQGRVSRNLQLYQVLKILRDADVHFTVKDRTIEILPSQE